MKREMITASIVLYNTPTTLVIQSLTCLEKSGIDKVFVIDNSSISEIEHIIKSNFTKVQYQKLNKNIGYGAAQNIGIKKAISSGSTYHIVLNPDVLFDIDVIKDISEFMNAHKDIGVLMPKVLYPDGDIQYLCKLLPSPIDMFGRRLLPKSMIKSRNDRFEMRQSNYDKTRNIPCLSGCFMFLNMSIIKNFNLLFDERFFLYFEDYDFVRRIHKYAKTVFYPKQTIIHYHNSEHNKNLKLFFISIISAIKYFNKWGWIFDKQRKELNKQAFSLSNIIED